MATIRKIFLLVLCFGIFPLTTKAASFALSPASGSYAVGETFLVTVTASSADQAANAVSGVLSFPQEKLEVVSLSKTDSIVNLWVQEPSFSNFSGTANFEGIMLNPGYTGSSGKIITIRFKVKGTGAVHLAFSSASILANDGAGTNILSSAASAQYSFAATAGGAETATSPTSNVNTPPAPVVSSPTHPDSAKWYKAKDVIFAWELAKDITGVNVLADHNPTTDPGTRSDGLFDSYEYKQVDDGVWYFHIRLRNSSGWGSVSHVKFQIDSRPPEQFRITFPHGNVALDPRPVVFFNTRDELSGVAYYEIQVGSGEAFRLTPGEIIASNPYILPVQEPGKRTIVVRAADRAGNETVATAEFEVIALESPIITSYSAELTDGDIIKITGTTYPDSVVTVSIKGEDGTTIDENGKSNSLGDFFVIVSRRLSAGIYTFTAKVTDVRGASSYPTERMTIVIKESPLFRFGWQFVNYASVILVIVSILLTFAMIAWYVWRKILAVKRRLKKEVREAEDILHAAFDKLRDDVQKHLKFLEHTKSKRELTAEEEKILKQLKEDLRNAERLVKKEIQDIEREIK